MSRPALGRRLAYGVTGSGLALMAAAMAAPAFAQPPPGPTEALAAPGSLRAVSRPVRPVVEMYVRTKAGDDRTVTVPHAAVVLIEAMFASPSRGGAV